jgi:tetratricopeptide (TPR) repeat protein
LSAEAQAYYEKSLRADEQILAKAKATPDFVEDPKLLLGVKLRMARSERRMGEFKKSIDLLSEILKEKPTLVEVQREAAYVLQDWSAKKPDYYNLAIRGAKKQKAASGRGENLIWGWATLAVRVQSDKKLSDDFHEARYNLAKCHLEQAKLQTDSAKKKELLHLAEKDILFTASIRPDMGGPDARNKSNSLLKAIQQLLGAKPTGLPAQKTAAKTATPPSGKSPPAGPAAKAGESPPVKPTVAAGKGDGAANPAVK